MNVFTIPPGAPFLPTFVRALAEGRLVPGFVPADDPLLLSEATIFVPTRRAARALEASFLDLMGADALLMPRIAPLGDVDEAALLTETIGGAGALAVPDAVDPLHRRLALARLVGFYAGAVRQAVANAGPELGGDDFYLLKSHPAAVLHLADALAGLIDDFETEGVAFSELKRLVPETHGRYWDITLTFLRIAGEQWPEHLRGLGRLDPSRRRGLLLAAEAERLRREPARGPVIAAGSTGSIPATADLLTAIARLPNGAVVLPGLDIASEGFPDPEDDDARAYGHPQFGLARLLRRLGIARTAVSEIGAVAADLQARRHFVGEAMRPAQSTDRWTQTRPAFGDLGGALAGVALVEAANEREEALAIALLLRESAQTPGRTAALITPDRQLAHRVQAELGRWDLDVEDSAGRPLAETPLATLALLLAETAAAELSPETLLPLLRHPLALFGETADEAARAADALELCALRGPAPRPGIAGLRAALAAAAEEKPRGFRARLTALDRQSALALVDRIATALQPLLGLTERPGTAEAADATLAALDRVTAGIPPDADPFATAAGAMLAERLRALAEADERLPLGLRDWAPTLGVLLSDLVAPAPPTAHPRLAILGLLEARLLSFDRVVLGGLAEGSWPPVPAADAWLNRTFRTELGLAPPERRVGLAAHDFTQALGAADAWLVRAERSGGQPTVPSRLLQRLEGFAGEAAWAGVRARGAALLGIVRALDRPEERPASASTRSDGRLKPPEPRPPTALRPDRLSITEIETLLRDPYAVYARRVLRLDPLDPVAEPPGAADRGTIVHDALAAFIERGIDPASPDAFDRLCGLGREKFGALLEMPDVAAVWWPRFERVARWFLGWERRRGTGISQTLVEQSAALTWTTVAGRKFTLNGRADRLDRTVAGWSVVDYKTGQAPTPKQVASGLSPQLSLEGALIREGAFGDAVPGPIAELMYVRLAGGMPAGEEKRVQGREIADADTLSREALAELKQLVDRFEAEDVPYLSRTRVKQERVRIGDYDHLCRVGEWSATGGVDDTEAEE